MPKQRHQGRKQPGWIQRTRKVRASYHQPPKKQFPGRGKLHLLLVTRSPESPNSTYCFADPPEGLHGSVFVHVHGHVSWTRDRWSRNRQHRFDLLPVQDEFIWAKISHDPQGRGLRADYWCGEKEMPG